MADPPRPPEPSMLTLLRDCLRYVEEADRRMPGGSGPWLLDALRQAIVSWETPGSLYGSAPPPEKPPVSPGGPWYLRQPQGGRAGGPQVVDAAKRVLLRADRHLSPAEADAVVTLASRAPETARRLYEAQREIAALKARVAELTGGKS